MIVNFCGSIISFWTLQGLIVITSSPLIYILEHRKINFALTLLILACLFIFDLFTVAYRDKFFVPRGRLPQLIGLFTAIILISTCYAIIVTQNDLAEILADGLQMLELPLGFYLALNALDSRDKIERVFKVCFFSVVISAFLQYALNRLGLLSELYLYVEDTLVKRIDFEVMPFICVICFAFFVNNSKKIVNWINLGLSIILLLLTYTRSYWIGVFVGFSYILLKKKNIFSFMLRPIALATVLLVICVLGFVVTSPLGQALTKVPLVERAVYTVDQLLHPVHPQQLQRQVEYYYAFKAMLDNPLTGAGLGGRYYAPIFQYASREVEYVEKHFIHSAYLHIGLYVGFSGLICFLAIFYICFVSNNKSLIKLKNNVYLLSINASIVTALSIAISKNEISKHPLSFILGVMIGIAYLVSTKVIDLDAGDS